MGTRKILVIDDEDGILTILKGFLGERGYSVITAGDGQEGLEMIKVGKERIDLIILDLLMPKMDGISLLRKLKEIGCAIPIVILTGSLKAERHGPVLKEMGFTEDDILEKPIGLEIILDKVNEKLA